MASRRSVLTRSPGRTGVSEGAMTSAGDVDARQQAVEVVAAGAGFVADGKRLWVAQSPEEAAHGALAVLELHDFGWAALCRQDAGGDRILVHVEGDPGPGCLGGYTRTNVRHGCSSFISADDDGRRGQLTPA